MLTYDKSMHIAGIHVEFFAQEIFDTCRIQNGTDTHNAALGDLNIFQCGIGQDIVGICDDQENRLSVALCDLRNDRFKNIDIFADELHAGIGLEPGLTGRQYDNAGISQIIVSTRVDVHGFCKRNPVCKIQSHPVRSPCKGIDQDHL